MLWTHAVVLLIVLAPPPCSIADLDRFPLPIHEEVCQPYGDGESEGYYTTSCPPIDPRMDWLRAQRAMHLRDWIEWDEQIAEQERIKETWYLLWKARVFAKPKCLNPYQCAEVLQDLRDILGERDYALGRMPPPIPVHRYTEIPR